MTEYAPRRRSWLAVAAMSAALVWMTFDQAGFERLLRAAFPAERIVVYERQTLAVLMAEHLMIVGVAAGIAILLGATLGVWLLSPAGSRFRGLAMSLASFGQTVPSVAVMALIVPAIGYGWEPVVIALVAYSVLPVMLNVVAGVESVPASAVDAARGIGMSDGRRLFEVELPLAAPVIVGGIKNVLVIAVSAATLGAVVGAGGLGVPIMAGVSQFNPALIVQGALPSALLALIVDAVL